MENAENTYHLILKIPNDKCPYDCDIFLRQDVAAMASGLHDKIMRLFQESLEDLVDGTNEHSFKFELKIEPYKPD